MSLMICIHYSTLNLVKIIEVVIWVDLTLITKYTDMYELVLNKKQSLIA